MMKYCYVGAVAVAVAEAGYSQVLRLLSPSYLLITRLHTARKHTWYKMKHGGAVWCLLLTDLDLELLLLPPPNHNHDFQFTHDLCLLNGELVLVLVLHLRYFVKNHI